MKQYHKIIKPIEMMRRDLSKLIGDTERAMVANEEKIMDLESKNEDLNEVQTLAMRTSNSIQDSLFPILPSDNQKPTAQVT